MKTVLREGLLELFTNPLAWASYAAWLAVWLSAGTVLGAAPGAFPALSDVLLFCWLACWLLGLLDEQLAPPINDAVLLVLGALTALTLWHVPNGTTPILLILCGIRFSDRLSTRWLILALLLANGYFFGVMLGPWQQSLKDTVLTVLAMGGFQLFAVMVMIYARRAQRLADDLQSVNARLLATRSLLAETARDHERLRLSRELHDVAGHKLTALKLNLRTLARKLEGEPAREVEKSTALADELLQDLRTVVRHLRENEGIDLLHSLRELGRPFPRPQLLLKVDDDTRVPRADQAEALLRVAQEGLTNAARHGPAQSLHVHLQREGDQLLMTVDDDGRLSRPPIPGNGLKGMRERLAELNGSLDISTSVLGGVRLCATLPMEHDG